LSGTYCTRVNCRMCIICKCMVQKGWDFSQRTDPSSSQRTPRIEDERNCKTWYSKCCEPKFVIEANKYWLSDNQLHRDLALESGFGLGVAEKREIVLHPIKMRGARWRSWLRHCATSRKVAGVIEIIHWHILPAALCFWDRLISIVLKSGSLNPLEPSGPVQACNGSTLTSLYLLPY